METNFTFLFTDIEGSTQLWERQAQAMSAALAYHDSAMREAIEANGGKIFKTVGDGVYSVFETADGALKAALKVQQLIHQAGTRSEAPILPILVRMGLYTGPAEERANDYFGPTLNRTARLMAAANGGQVLLSSTTKDQLNAELEIRDLGMHRLRDVNEPEHIFQAVSSQFPLVTKPIRSLTKRPTNLPGQLTSFIGREQNLQEICQRMRQTDTRLLTLIGPGGMGKTRSSIQVGNSLLDEYEDGVFFIPLAPLNRTEDITIYLAQALMVQEDESRPLSESVKAHLQARQVLLIFDNFEHILDSAPFVNELLAAAPRIKVLTTSREALFIYGERTYVLPPLKVPEPGADLQELAQSPAVKLFVDRIQSMQPEFEMAAENATDLIQICRQLDGLPLALELAAARVRDLSLHEIAEQLSHRLSLLSKGPRDLPSRQQTMRGAIEWSYQLFSPEEQRTFARLAVFEGQFFAEAAQVVSGTTDLTTFKSKGLVQQTENQIFSLLAVIREYALEQLEAFHEVEGMRQKHGDFYLQWLEKALDQITGRNQIEMYNQLKVEEYNLQAALKWFIDQQNIENAGRMVGIMWRYWATQSLLSEGESWMNQVLAHSDKLSPATYARVTQGAGRLTLLRHQYERSTQLQMKSLELFNSLGDVEGQAAVQLSLGETEYSQGHHIQAESYFGESLALFSQINNIAGVGRCLNNLGKIGMQSGDFAKAEPYLRESLTLAREHGTSEAIALSLYDLAAVLRAQEKYQEAEGFFSESLTLYSKLDFAVGIAVIRYNLGYTLMGLGKSAAAMEHFTEALKLLQTAEEPNAIAECLVGTADAFLHLGQRGFCIKLLSAVKSIMASMKADRLLDYTDQAQYERIYDAAKQDEAEWQTAWDAGQTTPLNQIIKEVFEQARVTT